MMLVRRVAIVLVAVGLLGMLVSPWLDGSQARYVHIRWRPGLTAGELQALEWRYGLRRITGEDRSYGYDLVNDTRRNIRALLNDPTVEDSADFDIGAASVASSAPVGIARTGFAWRWGLEEWIPGMVRWSRLLVLLGTVLLVGSWRWPAKAALIVGRSVSSVPPQMVRLTAGFALLLVGAGVFAAMPLLQGEATRSIGIRWRDAMDQDLRETLEERYGLRQQFSRGFNYRYDLVDESPQNIEKLLAEPSVEATDIDRTRLTADAFSAFSPQGDTRTGLAWKWGIEQYLPRLSSLAAAAMIVGLAMIMGWRRIGRMGAGVAWVGRRLYRSLHPWRTDWLREWWVRSGGYLHSMNLSMMTAILVGVLVMGGMLASTRVTRTELIFGEDMLIENATALLFLLTFMLGICFFIKERKSSLKMPLFLCLVTGLGLLGFLDEVSFGTRVFDLEIREYGDVRIDAVHDFVELAFYLARGHGLAILFTLLVTAIILVATCLVKREVLSSIFRRVFLSELEMWLSTFVMFSCFSVLLVVAMAIDSWNQVSYWYDLGIRTTAGLRAFEEVLELAAAFALLFCFQAIKLSHHELQTR